MVSGKNAARLRILPLLRQLSGIKWPGVAQNIGCPAAHTDGDTAGTLKTDCRHILHCLETGQCR